MKQYQITVSQRLNARCLLPFQITFVTIILIAFVSSVFAEVKFASPFTDHMVLQRDMKVPVWGTANPGEKIQLVFGKQNKSGVADASGKWMIYLDKSKAGGPFTLTAKGTNTVTLTDIYAGEVWLCSGQSNMDMTVAREDRYWCGVYNEAAELAAANYPLIRVFDVDFTPSDTILHNVKGTWEITSPTTVGHFSAAAYFFARELYNTLHVPIGLVTTAYGASTAEAWISKKTLEADTAFGKLLQQYNQKKAVYDTAITARNKYAVDLEKWTTAAATAKEAGKDPPRSPRNPDPSMDQHNPYVLYNGMVNALIPYAIRGAIWYQGESNIATKEIYAHIMESLVSNWRKDWCQGDFPFIYVQLANYGKKWDSLPASGGGTNSIREQQLKNLSIPNSAMVVAIDNADDPANIHPKNKQEIGRRLALAAEAKCYGKKIVYSGPIYKSMKMEGDKIRLYFDFVGEGLLAKDGPLKSFAIAADDKKFVTADAVIDGETILVSAPGITDPKAVRYAWGDNPRVNFYNKANLPASPFRTDDW
ncbi:MAG: sialate O-acetylesterase [Ferruginibacter sp.]